MNLRNKETNELSNPHIIMIELKELDKSGDVMLNGNPCKIKRIDFNLVCRWNRPYILGSNIFTNKEETQNFPMYGEVEVPIIKRTD